VKGFTVLELMIALAVMGLSLVMALPSLQKFSRAQVMKSAVRQLHTDLETGRSEAILRNAQVIACPGSPAAGCLGSSDWTAGWIVFADENSDTKRQHHEPVIRHGQGHPRLKITFSPGRQHLRFGSDGSTPGSNGSLVICGSGGPEEARKLVISNIGRIRRGTATNVDREQCPKP
jgi:type IV fimbrial biogenesis protein FimT